ncbi:hypothetical protein SASPL_145392 [Salvia splendens]|uniref:Uncharacterized protein n=1 Tax=Salvia splendens TaxID=180675 RepID=A0A8X8Z838_SALSN|nr:hypothetical protein SASPL_145392 [Salvia splendens]
MKTMWAASLLSVRSVPLAIIWQPLNLFYLSNYGEGRSTREKNIDVFDESLMETKGTIVIINRMLEQGLFKKASEGGPFTEGFEDVGRAKNGKGDRTCHAWTDREEVLLITQKDLVVRSWKADNGFRNDYQTRIIEAMKREFPNTDLRTNRGRDGRQKQCGDGSVWVAATMAIKTTSTDQRRQLNIDGQQPCATVQRRAWRQRRRRDLDGRGRLQRWLDSEQQQLFGSSGRFRNKEMEATVFLAPVMALPAVNERERRGDGG